MKTKFIQFVLFFFILTISSCSSEDPLNFNGLVKTVGSGTDEIKVLIVKGTPYEMGRQMGSLLKEDIDDCLNDFLTAVKSDDPDMYSDDQLDQAWKTNAPYIDSRIIEEMQGMADGSGLPLKIIQRAHMVPVVSSYACSGVAVWGSATKNQHTYQLRNLDFTKWANLQEHPLIVFYIPKNGTPHANITFAGYIGSHTGISANHLVFGEKGASPSREYPYDLNGSHFSFLFRSMMYDSKSLDDILNTVKTTKLIKRYYLYFSDGNTDTQGGAKVRVSTPDDVKLSVWKDNDQSDPVAPYVAPGCIYHTMKNSVAFVMIQKNLGKFDENNMIELSKAVADKDGNLLNVVYDATTLEMWVAYANKWEDASQQTYVHLNMNDYLK
jgi:hypothetical protein